MNESEYPGVFVAAVTRVLRNEGGWSKDPADPGGDTRFGLSRRAYPALDLERLTEEQAIAIYFRDRWQRGRWGELPDSLAVKLFDLSVNIGARAATQCIQRALRACARQVAEDGMLGEATIAAARGADCDALLAALRSEAAAHYRIIAALWERERRPDADRFLEGWLRRAYE